MKLEIEVDDDTVMYVGRFLSMLDPKIEANTHGPLDMAVLARMLLEDVALAVTRPRSSEGSKMGDLLASHGYEMMG